MRVQAGTALYMSVRGNKCAFSVPQENPRYGHKRTLAPNSPPIRLLRPPYGYPTSTYGRRGSWDIVTTFLGHCLGRGVGPSVSIIKKWLCSVRRPPPRRRRRRRRRHRAAPMWPPPRCAAAPRPPRAPTRRSSQIAVGSTHLSVACGFAPQCFARSAAVLYWAAAGALLVGSRVGAPLP
jgi:hypothetical protein